MRRIHIHLHGKTDDAGWDESKHPRKGDGKFGSGGDDTSRILAASKPITAEEALAMVSGKTEKPGGTDPAKFIGAGAGNGREYRYGDIPLDLFVANESGDRYDGTVNEERAAEYAKRPGDQAPPVIATQGRTTTQLRIIDGGHRISAARRRGDKTIRAIVSVKARTP